ncbi:MAG: hypothetical protein Q9168_005405 [Polycauliona sp. 1 TL-2023]
MTLPVRQPLRNLNRVNPLGKNLENEEAGPSTMPAESQTTSLSEYFAPSNLNPDEQDENSVPREPLFQSFGRSSPTEMDIEHAEEIDYDDLPQEHQGPELQEVAVNNPSSALLPLSSASKMGDAGVDTGAPEFEPADDFTDGYLPMFIPVDMEDYDGDVSGEIEITDEEMKWLEEMTDQELWEMILAGEYGEGMVAEEEADGGEGMVVEEEEENDDKENMDPVGGLAGWSGI